MSLIQHSIAGFLLVSFLLLLPDMAAQAQTSHPNRLSLSLYQVGVPLESGYNTPVHRAFSGLYYERNVHDQWQLTAGLQYWNGAYNEGANRRDAGPEGVGTVQLKEWGILAGARYLPAWCRTPFLQPFLQYDWMYGQSEFGFQSPDPIIPGGATTLSIDSHTFNCFLRAGVETYWVQSRIVLGVLTAWQTKAYRTYDSELNEAPYDARFTARVGWIPLEVRAGFRF